MRTPTYPCFDKAVDLEQAAQVLAWLLTIRESCPCYKFMLMAFYICCSKDPFFNGGSAGSIFWFHFAV
jgi:hypothetical protein